MTPPALQKAFISGFELSHDISSGNGTDLSIMLNSDLNTVPPGTADYARTGRSIWAESIDVKLEIYRTVYVNDTIQWPTSQTVQIYLILDNQNNGTINNPTSNEIWINPHFGVGNADAMTAFQNPATEQRYNILWTYTKDLPNDVVWEGENQTTFSQGVYFIQKQIPLGFKIDFKADTGEPTTKNLFLWIKYLSADMYLTPPPPPPTIQPSGSATQIQGQTCLRFYDNPFTTDVMF